MQPCLIKPTLFFDSFLLFFLLVCFFFIMCTIFVIQFVIFFLLSFLPFLSFLPSFLLAFFLSYFLPYNPSFSFAFFFFVFFLFFFFFFFNCLLLSFDDFEGIEQHVEKVTLCFSKFRTLSIVLGAVEFMALKLILTLKLKEIASVLRISWMCRTERVYFCQMWRLQRLLLTWRPLQETDEVISK